MTAKMGTVAFRQKIRLSMRLSLLHGGFLLLEKVLQFAQAFREHGGLLRDRLSSTEAIMRS